MLKYKCRMQYIQKCVCLDFLDPNQLENSYLIENSFGPDIEQNYQIIRQEVEAYLKVVFGESNEYGGGGNVNVISANREYTIIFGGYDGDDDEIEIVCKIETIEFVKLMLVWGEAVFRYNNKIQLMTNAEFQESLIWLGSEWNQINAFETVKKQMK